MSKYSHVPWSLGIMAVGLALTAVGVPASFVMATGGWATIFIREVTQEEYRVIERRGGLRASIDAFRGLKFWKWNRHSKLETVASIIAVYPAALVLYLGWGI